MRVRYLLKTVYDDWKISIQLFFQNFKAFFIVNILFYLLSLLVSFVFFHLHRFIEPPSPNTQPESSDLFHFVEIVIYTFMWCQYGLAHDIMTSGDYCTEWSRIGVFYKRYWVHYLILSILINISKLVWDLFNIPFFPESQYIRILSDFVIFLLFIELFPILNSKNEIWLSIKENFSILRKNFIRILIPWALFYLIFELFFIFLKIPMQMGPTFIFAGFRMDYRFFLQNIITFVKSLFSFSLMALLSTRIYNNITLEKSSNENTSLPITKDID